jgi:hypothetical protein
VQICIYWQEFLIGYTDSHAYIFSPSLSLDFLHRSPPILVTLHILYGFLRKRQLAVKYTLQIG